MPPKSSTKPTKVATLPKQSKWANHKTTPKKPLTAQEQLKRLFTTLCAQIDGGHFSNAVKTCDKSMLLSCRELRCGVLTRNTVLRLQPTDVDARQTKLFLLLQTEQYEAALTLIDLDKDPSDHAYERAYSLYRMQRESAAKEVLEELKEEEDDNRGIVHLEAQLASSQTSSRFHSNPDIFQELSRGVLPGSVRPVQPAFGHS